ncbi:MAG TPA: hypothetical protein VGK78_02305 [Nocardioides sp.]|uniref:hypothetical protein n=1 Tax=Nocardioides sp. TaxID=35761 RepID=UPI002F40A622
MFHRPSLRSTVTTLAAAVVLVGGADLAAYAANGHPLILGHANKAVGTTSLKNIGRGPALSLNSSKHSSPLTVNSSKLVRNLNAEKVGGMTARQLGGVLRYRIGSVGSTFTNASPGQVFNAKIPKGTYQVSVTGLATETGAASGDTDSITCLALDRAALLAALGGGTLDYSKVYALTGNKTGDFDFGVINYTNPAQKISGSNIALGCLLRASSTGVFTEAHQIAFTFKPVTVGDKPLGTTIPIPRSAQQRIANGLH